MLDVQQAASQEGLVSMKSVSAIHTASNHNDIFQVYETIYLNILLSGNV
jgi:hypothetical protein